MDRTHDTSNIPVDKDGLLTPEEMEVAQTTTGYVDKATERKIMRKLDLRIIPMVMWM